MPLDSDALPEELFGLADFLEYSNEIYDDDVIVEDGETVEYTDLPADFGSTTITATTTATAAVSEQTKPAA